MSRNRATKESDTLSIAVDSELEEGLLSRLPVIAPRGSMDYRKCRTKNRAQTPQFIDIG